MIHMILCVIYFPAYLLFLNSFSDALFSHIDYSVNGRRIQEGCKSGCVLLYAFTYRNQEKLQYFIMRSGSKLKIKSWAAWIRKRSKTTQLQCSVFSIHRDDKNSESKTQVWSSFAINNARRNGVHQHTQTSQALVKYLDNLILVDKYRGFGVYMHSMHMLHVNKPHT